jgi:hypothetical protein
MYRLRFKPHTSQIQISSTNLLSVRDMLLPSSVKNREAVIKITQFMRYGKYTEEHYVL